MYVHNNTLFIAGTNPRTMMQYTRDILTDMTIPVHMLRYTPRFQTAEHALHMYPQVTTIVGHSLGGAIADVLVSDNERLQGRVYGAPILYAHPRIRLFRHAGDPVSVSSRISGASERNSVYIGNPHSYRGFETFRN